MSSVQHHELQEIADHAMASIADQLLLPQSHYIDVLLDLLVAAPSPIVRSAIADRLREIRFVSMVTTDEVRADLYGIVAISDFSDAASDDLAWAEQALMCDCTTCVAALNAEQGRSSCSEVHAEGAQAMFADTNTQHRTSTTRNTNAVDRAPRRDIDCQARASEFLTDLIGSPPENLLWDDTYHLQGHSQLHGRELVVIAPRDEHHQTVVLTAEDWDAIRRATTDQRRDLLDTCAIADHEQLVAVMATTTTPRTA